MLTHSHTNTYIARNTNTLPNSSRPQPVPRKRCSSSSSHSPTTANRETFVNNLTSTGPPPSVSTPTAADVVSPDEEEDIYSESTPEGENVNPVVCNVPRHGNTLSNFGSMNSGGFSSAGFQPVQTDALLRQSGHGGVSPTVGVDQLKGEMGKMNLEDIHTERARLEEEVKRFVSSVCVCVCVCVYMCAPKYMLMNGTCILLYTR